MSWSEKFNDKLKPITDFQKEYFKKESQEYILIANDNGDGICTRCGSDVQIKAKHLYYEKCPVCNKSLKIHHLWRTQEIPKSVDYHVMAKAIDNHTLVLRYIQVVNESVREIGRIYIDEYRSDMEFWCNTIWNKRWVKGKAPFFTAPNVFNGYGTSDVYNATPYMRTFFSECRKLDCFKYNPIEELYDKTRYASQMHYLIRSAKINEMMRKSGLKHMADNYHLAFYSCRNHDHTYNVDNKKTKINEVLRISKHTYNVWKTSGSANAETLALCQKYANKLTAEKVLYEYKIKNYGFWAEAYLRCLSKSVNLTGKKWQIIDGYINRKNINIYDYVDYLDMMKKIGYDMSDKQYIMPRDFAKDKTRICNEYNDYLERQKKEASAKRDGLIKKISDALHKMPNLDEYLNGSNGLLVYVPESVNDLQTEGRALHNCIASYEERIAQGKTMVFYIRQLSNPTAPFVAMEYCNGSVIQCRYDENVDVRSKDDETSRNIIDFVERFASALRENNVLAG